MNTKQIIEEAESNLIHTYNRYQIVLDKGDGVRLYDTDGKEYLDFGAGIAVFALGYNNKEYNDALKAQIDKLVHTSNYFYNEPAAKAAKALTAASGMDRVFFTNSGTEAVEGAIKLAKKYAYLKDGSTDHEIIAMEHSFHGRSMGALAVTGNKHYQEAFGPMIPGIRFAQFNNLDSVKELVNDKTCAIIFETIQGEGGVYPAKKEFIEGVRKLCDEKGILLILDEIQCGMGRSGSMFAYQQYGVKPDIVTSAKALGCGVPIGAFMATEQVAKALVPGDHGTTYGGNPLACAAAVEVFRLFEKLNVTDNVKNVGKYLETQLKSLVEEYDIVKAQRGMGLIQGIELTVNPKNVIAKCLDNGLILFSAGTNVIRFVPPLVITREDVDQMMARLKKALDEVSQNV
ncbi:MAG: aspartate aminotransferase family protein [Clostridia bacterium]|nr:aspartate aminotransferase family protein [Clostridia bacterium]